MSTAPSRGAFAGVSSVITVAFMGSVVVSPLYPLYQRAFGFSDLTLTLVYAVYAIGNVAALLAFGQISDQVGRRRAALVGLGLAVLAGLAFLLAQGTAWLFLGRLLIGLAVGISSGTGTAWLAELYGEARRPLASVVAAVANMTGIALGPLIGGVLAQYADPPLRVPLVAYLVLVVVSGVLASRAPESHAPTVASLREVRVQPRIGVPRSLVPAFLPPAVTGLVIFSLGGLYFALVPGIMARDLGVANVALSGLVIVEVGLIAAAGIWLAQGVAADTAMRTGLALMPPAVVLLVLAQALPSLPLLLGSAALTGLGLALGYRGSLAVVNRIAPDDRRAEVTSSYFVACFTGNSIPVVGIGILTVLAGPLAATIVFAAVVVLLAVVTLLVRPG